MQPSKLLKILRYGIYLSALMPLVIFSDYVSPFHFGKIILFRSLVDIMVVLYVALVIMDRSFLPKRNKIFWAITFFTAVFGITTLTSISVYQSFWGTLERMGGWFSFFHFWLFFVILTSVIRTREEWFNLIKISVVVALLSTFYGFLQKTDLSFIVGAGGRSRIFGTIGNPALFAGYELLNVFLGLLLVFKPDIPRNQKLLYGFATLVNLIAVISTAVRGSLLAIVVSAVLFALIYPASASGYKKLRKAILLFIALAVVAEVILIFVHNSDFVKNNSYLTRISDVSPSTYTVDTRFWAWQAGLEGWKSSAKTIVFGWGPENFNIPFSIHFNPKFYNGPGSETLFDRAHNMFIEVLVTMGLLGFISYILIFVALFYLLNKALKHSPSKEQRVYAAIMISGLVAYIIHNSFIFDTSANLLLFFTTMGFSSWLVSATVVADKNAKPKHINYGLVFTIACLLGIIMAVLIYKTDVEPAQANYATTRGIVASWNNDQTLAVQKFQEALSYDNTFGEYEIRNRFAQYVLENYDNLTPKETANRVVLLAIDAVKKNLSFKDDYLPLLYLSRSYITLGKTDPKSPYNNIALQYSQQALDISPTFVRTYYEVAQAYLNKKDYDNAIAAFKKAAELNPHVAITYWYWGITEIERGNTAFGLQMINTQVLDRNYVLGEQDYARLVSIYIAQKDIPHVADVYQKLITLKPQNPQYHASLASAYAQLGRIDDAVQEARIAVQLDPSFEMQARAFVQSLGRQW